MAHRSRAQVTRALQTRRSQPPSPGRARLSVIVPAYREVDAIGATVERIRVELAAVADDGGLEVVVVDDGSGDGTDEAARAAGADQVLAFPANRGKGAAVRAGMLAAAGRTLVFTDADLSYSPAQIERLLVAIEDGWDVVVGNRHHEGSTTIVAASALRQVGGRAINLATRAVLVGAHQDTQCGLKAFRSDVARTIFGHSRIDGFAFDVEVLHLVERYELSLTEVEVEVVNTETSTVHVVRDALLLLADLARIRRGDATGAYDLSPADQASLGLGHPRPGE
ncbi:MAG: hypothetical protein JWO77_2989 [Ilumatobacteraceae bacterium]|nr:hypothetical protein [Ilumatobacteraceae bacterium]